MLAEYDGYFYFDFDFDEDSEDDNSYEEGYLQLQLVRSIILSIVYDDDIQ